MPNISLPRITTSYSSAAAFNAAMEQLEDELNDVLSRLGDAPNQMQASVDMNSNRLLNLPIAGSEGEPVTLFQLRSLTTPIIYEPNAHTHPWGQITGVPIAFPPSAHTHSISQITGLEAQLTSINTTIGTLEDNPRIFVQATDPGTSAEDGDLWIF